MKKYFVVLFLILICSIRVRAENSLKVECQKSEINVNEHVKCDLNLVYDNSSFDTIEFNYTSSFDVTFDNITPDGNYVKIEVNNLSASSMKIGEIDLVSAQKGEQNIKLSNIKLLKDNNSVLSLRTVNTYVNVINPSLNRDNSLNGIIINGVPLKNFEKDKLSYGPIYTEKELNFLDAVRGYEQSLITGLGNVRVREGKEVTKKIVVTAESGEKREYTLLLKYEPERNTALMTDITLPDVKSSDTNIYSLELYNENQKLDFEFDSSKTSYVYKLEDGNISKLTVKAELHDENAYFEANYGPRDVDLAYGSNIIEVKVIAQDASKVTYTINVERPDNRSDNTLLSLLMINERKIELNDNNEYNLILSHNIEQTNVVAEAVDKKASIEYENITLVDGDNELVIKVIAENGSSKDYNIHIKRLTEDETIKLEKITINNHHLSFDVNKYQYDVTINSGENKLDFVINPSGIDYEILGNNDLKDGSVITIKVKSNNEEKTYTFKVHQESNLIYYLVFIGGIIALGGSIFYAIKIKKKNFTKM